jgi:hypothetical protein
MSYLENKENIDPRTGLISPTQRRTLKSKKIVEKRHPLQDITNSPTYKTEQQRRSNSSTRTQPQSSASNSTSSVDRKGQERIAILKSLR